MKPSHASYPNTLSQATVVVWGESAGVDDLKHIAIPGNEVKKLGKLFVEEGCMDPGPHPGVTLQVVPSHLQHLLDCKPSLFFIIAAEECLKYSFTVKVPGTGNDMRHDNILDLLWLQPDQFQLFENMSGSFNEVILDLS